MTAMAIAGTAMSAGGTILGGIQANRGAKAEQSSLNTAAAADAERAKANAASELAASQQQMFDTQRKGNVLLSNERAIAAASGGGVENPTIEKIFGDTAARGNYLARSELYTGQSRAQSILDNSAMETANAAYKGRVARVAGKNALVGSILEGAGQGLSGGAKIYNAQPKTPDATPTLTGWDATVQPYDPWNTKVTRYG